MTTKQSVFRGKVALKGTGASMISEIDFTPSLKISKLVSILQNNRKQGQNA